MKKILLLTFVVLSATSCDCSSSRDKIGERVVIEDDTLTVLRVDRYNGNLVLNDGRQVGQEFPVITGFDGANEYEER